MIVSKSRSFAKSITWRIVGLIVGFAFTYFYTRETDTATKVTLSTNIVMFILYYAHERWWNKIKWGRE